MITDIWQHWRYFVPRFAGYGTVLGGLFGALTYPILGAIVGAPWGLVGGLVLGLLMGIGVPIYNRFFAPDDHERYHKQLTFGAGFLATITMALPLLFIYALVAGLVTAYVTHQYAENPAQLTEKRKHSTDAYQRRDRVFTHAARAMMNKAKYLIGMIVTVALIGYVLTGGIPFASFAFFGVLGTIYGFLIASVIAAVNALFIVMVNRLFLDPNMPKDQYKIRIVPAVGVLTLFLSMIVSGAIGAPFAAVVGALGASKYADWYYEAEETTAEKAKRSADHLRDDSDDTQYADEIYADAQAQRMVARDS
ncbi:MAG: hypothetical protein ACFE0Q_03350 [Anaerolineae bacterium]